MRRELILILCIGVIGAVSFLTLAHADEYISQQNKNEDSQEKRINNTNLHAGFQYDILRPTNVTSSDLAENYDVIVIGAGMAGIEAAHQLQSRGIDVVVLEADNRIGGRTWTVIKDGLSLDLGASWIHGGIKDNYTFPKFPNPIYQIAKDKEIQVNKTDHLYTTNFYTSSGHLLNLTDTYNSTGFQKFLNWEKPRLPPNSSVQDVMNEYKQKMSYTKQSFDWINYNLFMYWDVVLDQGDDASKVSSADLYNGLGDNFYFDNETFDETIFSEGGYSQIVNNLADGLDIKHANVTKIDHSNSTVMVTTDKGIFHAKYVISTLPLGVLKSGKVEFVPSLDDNKTKAINNLGMNVMDKAYFIFDNSSSLFWNNDKNNDWIVRVPDNASDTGWLAFFNMYKYYNKPVLLAFNTGDFARKLETESDNQIRQDGLSVLSKMYNNSAIKTYTPDIVVTRHYQNTTRYGSYSYLGKNASMADVDYLAKPTNDNRLFFAGEATNKYFIGTVHGAYISGFRAAEEILRLEGKLDPPLIQFENGIYPDLAICYDNQSNDPNVPFCNAKMYHNIVDYTETVKNNTFNVRVDTARSIPPKEATFDPNTKRLTMNFYQLKSPNRVDIIVPHALLGGNYTLLVNGNEQNLDSLHFGNYGNYSWFTPYTNSSIARIEIIGTTAAPEFPVVVPILVLSIVSLLVFYQIKSRIRI